MRFIKNHVRIRREGSWGMFPDHSSFFIGGGGFGNETDEIVDRVDLAKALSVRNQQRSRVLRLCILEFI